MAWVAMGAVAGRSLRGCGRGAEPNTGPERNVHNVMKATQRNSIGDVSWNRSPSGGLAKQPTRLRALFFDATTVPVPPCALAPIPKCP